MLGPRRPEHYLVFVAESDDRFYPQDCVEAWYNIIQDEAQPWLDETCLLEVTNPTARDHPSLSPAEGDDPSPSPEAAATTQKNKRRRYLGWTAAQRTSLNVNKVEMSQELRDMVQICNRAAMI